MAARNWVFQEVKPEMTKRSLTLILWLLCAVWAVPATAQERVIVSHSVRGSLSIGPLLYGIQKGFYRNEGIDLVYVSIRADLGIKTLVSGDVDFIYSAGTGIRAAVQGIPVKILSLDFTKVFHSLMVRPEITTAAALKDKKLAVSSLALRRIYLHAPRSERWDSILFETLRSCPWAETRCDLLRCRRERSRLQ